MLSFVSHMNNHPSDETVIAATPEISPLVGSLSAANLGLLSFAIALFLLVVILYTRGKSKSSGNALLLVGPPDSGKTAILSNLAYNQTLPSHTSLQTNSAQMTLSSTKTLRVIDVPGHPRIRDQFREHLKDAKAVAFVVDCSTISRNGSVVAEHMHHVLHAITSLPPTQSTPTLLILAHKTDLLKAGASSNSASEAAIARVRTILERELEKRRASQSGGVGMESLGAEGEGTEMGGLECSGAAGGTFRFNEWEGGDVDFVSTWVKVGEAKDESSNGGLEDLKDWLSQLSK
ncbi:signal recognition particle receptor beta subunit-domain-containing protein [Lanmaoa asiatica]|nr:signal recognition particle receptor beta subunit-domain-containing protein [Lanmaoa asiatica]